jgi:hypothetical protein
MATWPPTRIAARTRGQGVKLVDLLGIIRRLQCTEGTSAVHFSAQVQSWAWTCHMYELGVGDAKIEDNVLDETHHLP